MSKQVGGTGSSVGFGGGGGGGGTGNIKFGPKLVAYNTFNVTMCLLSCVGSVIYM